MMRALVAPGGRLRSAWTLLALSSILAGLAGCSGSLDPREQLVPHVDQPVPGANMSYPNLGSVPDQAPPTMSAKERAQIQKQLTADAKNPIYKSGTDVPSLPAPPPPLPQGFLTAQAPVQAPPAAAPTPTASQPGPAAQGSASSSPPASAPAQPPEAPASPAPAFGAMGAPQQVGVVFFSAGSSQVDPAQIAKLKPIIRRMRQSDGVLQIVGHSSREADAASATGKIADFNLASDRANAVARILMRLGATSSELIITAQGDNSPPPAIAGISGEAASQRVDIFLEHN